jgi:enamine deaminase RidA (YjgF/YER057c/UK114 family)
MPRIQRVSSPHVAEPPPERWSNAMRVGETLYTAGFTSRSNDGKTIEGKGEYEQARIVFGKIRHLVEAAGGTMADVVKLNIYVVDIGKNTEVWRARREFFTGNFPVSTLVEVKGLATPEILVEIEAIAHIGASRG